MTIQKGVLQAQLIDFSLVVIYFTWKCSEFLKIEEKIVYNDY